MTDTTGWAVKYWPNTTIAMAVRIWSLELDGPVPEDHIFWPASDAPPPTPQDSPEQQEAIANALLDAKLRQANAQLTALQGRVDAINDAIEFDEALPEEIAELPIRKAQLTAWKKYRIELGRVKTAPGWYQTPAWPTAPEPYTSETAARPVQAS